MNDPHRERWTAPGRAARFHLLGRSGSNSSLTPVLSLVASMMLIAVSSQAFPGGTPDFQTDVGPYCAACHASTADSDLAGFGPRAAAELAVTKHLTPIHAGEGPYAALSPPERAQLIELIQRVDQQATVSIEFPAKVAAGATFRVTVHVAGGAGPSVGVGLVDRAHRFFARPASAAGWQVLGAPSVIGPKGPQSQWLARRPERVGRGITFVNVTGMDASAEENRWSKAKVIYTLKAPLVPGDYPLAGAFFYGTETATQLGSRVDAQRRRQPLGGEAGRSGRIKFTKSGLVKVTAPESIPASPSALGPAPAAASAIPTASPRQPASTTTSGAVR